MSFRQPTCLFELYGDQVHGFRLRQQTPGISVEQWTGRLFASIRVTALNICDLTSPKTPATCAMATTVVSNAELSIPQAWGKAIMEHPANFQGIRFTTRFGKTCLAVFDGDPSPAVKAEASEGAPMDEVVAANEFLSDFEIALI